VHRDAVDIPADPGDPRNQSPRLPRKAQYRRSAHPGKAPVLIIRHGGAVDPGEENLRQPEHQKKRLR